MKTKLEYTNFENYRINFKWILPVFLAILIGSCFGVKYIKKLTYNNIYNNIEELTKQSATQLNLSITNQKQFVEVMVDTIEKGHVSTKQEIFDTFKETLEDYQFSRLVILDKQGNGITSDGVIVQNYPVEEFFGHDEVYLSENRPSIVSNKQINAYAKTFELNGEELILLATINTDDYREILSRRLFNGKGGTYLINNDGLVLIDSFDMIKENNVNLYQYLKTEANTSLDEEEANKLEQMAKNVKEKKTGSCDITIDENQYFIHYGPININDWYVVSLIPADTIAKELRQFLTISLGICLLINWIILLICVYIDISNQNKNKKLYKVAYIDPVTLLGNESYFKTKGAEEIEKNRKDRYAISIDINKFKTLNKLYGYDFCNQILKTMGEKLIAILPEENITCRLYSDVFASTFVYKNNIKPLLKQIIQEVSSLEIEEEDIHLNLSMGVYKLREKDKDINKILDKLYASRSTIKGNYYDNYYIYDETIEQKMIEEQQIESSMEMALKNKEFKVVYQPKFDTKTEKMVGAEALVRWYREDKVIPPNKFIPLFEKNKFILKLDLYIFEQVCKDLANWKKEYNMMPKISINVSKEQFVDADFIDKYVKIADKYELDTNQIDLEITESATIDKEIDILAILNNIKKKGFLISIDDFGTGYSSLSMLQNMPIDIIKIDKVFVDKADLNSNKNMIDYIMLISKQLGVKTVAEGIETQEQVEYMKKIKCDFIQGYYYSKPISKEEFEEYLK